LTVDGSWMSSAMLIEDGRIAAYMAVSELPVGVPVYDLGDAPVTPGLQSAWWVNPAAGTPISKDSNAAQQFAADGFDPSAANVRRLLESGVNAVHVVNGQDNVVAGQTAWLRLLPSSSGGRGERRGAAEQWVLTERARNIERFPSTLVGQVSLLRDRLAGRGDATTVYLPEAAVAKLMAQRSAQLQAVQSGKMPVVVAAESDGEIDAALRLLAGTEVEAWLYGPAQVRPFAERLAATGVGLIVNPVSEWMFDWYISDLVAARAQGVKLLLAGRHGNELRATAAALVAAGLSREDGRRLLTSDPQVAFDPHAVAGLQVGAPAEFLVWSDDPLDLTSRLIWTSWGK
jgi:imidazolonepropionase-like amidohydrolase